MVRSKVPSIQTAFLILQCIHTEIDIVISYLFCIGSCLKCQEGKPVRGKGPTVTERREYSVLFMLPYYRLLTCEKKTSSVFFARLRKMKKSSIWSVLQERAQRRPNRKVTMVQGITTAFGSDTVRYQVVVGKGLRLLVPVPVGYSYRYR